MDVFSSQALSDKERKGSRESDNGYGATDIVCLNPALLAHQGVSLNLTPAYTVI